MIYSDSLSDLKFMNSWPRLFIEWLENIKFQIHVTIHRVTLSNKFFD
jgi:hypothetical protein